MTAIVGVTLGFNSLGAYDFEQTFWYKCSEEQNHLNIVANNFIRFFFRCLEIYNSAIRIF